MSLLFLPMTWFSPQLKTTHVPTRTGHTVEVWSASPANPRALLFVFLGRNGSFIDEESQLSNNFFLRQRDDLVKLGYAVVIMGASSWATNGYTEEDRLSQAHLDDAKILIERFNPRHLPVFLLGSSRGTISALRVGIDAKISDLKGLVLLSPVVMLPVFQNIQFKKLTTPVLVIQHFKDKCDLSLYADVKTWWDHIPHDAHNQFLTIRSGGSNAEKPCRSLSHHGFWRNEEQVIGTIDERITKYLTVVRK